MSWEPDVDEEIHVITYNGDQWFEPVRHTIVALDGYDPVIRIGRDELLVLDDETWWCRFYDAALNKYEAAMGLPRTPGHMEGRTRGDMEGDLYPRPVDRADYVVHCLYGMYMSGVDGEVVLTTDRDKARRFTLNRAKRMAGRLATYKYRMSVGSYYDMRGFATEPKDGQSHDVRGMLQEELRKLRRLLVEAREGEMLDFADEAQDVLKRHCSQLENIIDVIPHDKAST